MFSGKRVLVTGASRGIGRSIALAFAEVGAIVVVSARPSADLDAAAEQVAPAGGFALPCDVTDPAQVADIAAVLDERLGGVDILVNNAGAAGSHKLLGHPDELWHRLLAANLTSVYYVTKQFAGGMAARRWGRIITVASIAGKIGMRYMAAYTASKHGVIGLTRSLAAELVAAGVTVNAICPGYVDTPMTDAAVSNIVGRTGMDHEAARVALANTSPQQRLIEAGEVAGLALYLASDAARGITGQAINLDGGAVTY
jgi:NAD(P)-dependent dehydrogenase (short-subunit alcohol dehydrogenase family)